MKIKNITFDNTGYPIFDDGSFTLNSWIAPNGDFYGFDGAKHLLAANAIAIFVLNKDQSVLNHGVYFKDGFDSYLLKNGWAEVKDTSWMSGVKDTKIIHRKDLTQKQIDTIFDLEEKLNIKLNYYEA